MFNRKNWFIIILILLVLGAIIYFSLGSVKKDKKENLLRIVYKPNANYLIYFVARENGYFKEEELEIEEIEMASTNLMVEALLTGRADFNPSNSVPALYAAEQNAPGTFLFLYITLMEKGRTNNAIIVKKNSNFNSLFDLQGKTIASPPGATPVILLNLIFKDVFNIDNAFTVQELEPRIQLQALDSEKVDAVFAIEPLITYGETKGISRILEADVMENHIMNPIPIAGGVITTNFAKNNPKTAEKLYKVMNKAIDFIRSNEKEAKLIMAKAIEMPEGTAMQLGINTYWKLDEVNYNYVQQLSDIFFEKKALEKQVDTKMMYWKSK
ncbi:MAG: ABC transporter substrate-binding protein [Promethearchaeota archaeon]